MPDPFLRLRCLVILTLCATSAAAAAQPSADQVLKLVSDLANPDPQQRERAAHELRQLGGAARPALIDASRGEHPAISAAAASLLVELPWTTPMDPMPMQIALRTYGRASPAERMEAISEIARKYPRAVTNQILLRLLCEEPNEDVCWRVAATLRRQLDEDTVRRLRDLEPRHERASLLTLLGRVWIHLDTTRSRALFRRAIDVELRRPSQDEGELNIAFDALCGAARQEQRYDDAAELRRSQSSRAVTIEASVEAMLELFHLHALHGPLRGWESDAREGSHVRGRAEALYAHAAMHARGGDELMVHLLLHTARSASFTARSRMAAASFLRRLQEAELAVRELRAVSADDSRETIIDRINARMMLAHLAAERNDHAAAAEHLSAVIELVGSQDQRLRRTDSDGRSAEFEPDKLKIDICWHRFRAALGGGDAAKAASHLSALLESRPTSSEIVLDLVGHLREQRRTDEAEQVFQHAYRAVSEQLGRSPDDPHLMNQLAWLCARSDRHLDRAVDLSQRAIELAPANASYLDTAAEACFRVGRIDDAIRLEELAITLEPDYPFMQEQLARFRQARSK